MSERELESRMDSVERAIVKLEAAIEAVVNSVQRVSQSLDQLTRMQIDQATDRSERLAQYSECKTAIARAHARLDKIETNLTRVVLIVLGAVIAAVLANAGLK